MSEESDHVLMLAVSKGELAGLAELFERHHVRLYNFFLQLSGNKQSSEDMVQDTYMKMLKYAGSYSKEGNFMPWVFNIARNIVADYFNKEKIKLSKLSDVEPDMFISTLPDPEYLREMSELQRKLQNALLRLPADKRELILLSKVNLLKMTDLASLYDCSLSTLKVRLHRAIGLLMEYYETESIEKATLKSSRQEHIERAKP